MNNVFITVLNMSVTAGIVAVIVIIVRLLLKKTPKIFSYALWAVVLFRMLCPFSFESIVSILPTKSEPIPQDIVTQYVPKIDSGIIFVDNAVNRAIQPAALSTEPEAKTENAGLLKTVITISSYIWLLGIVGLFLYVIISYIKIKRNIFAATLVKDNIFETDQIKTPFVMGFIKPKIYLPLGLKESEADYIINHERTHIKRGDHLIKLLAFAGLALHWFNPLMWLSYFLMSKDMELSCDEKVMKKSREDIRVDYSSSLLSLSVRQSGLPNPLAFGESNVKSRIKNVLNFKKPAFWISILSVIIVLSVTVALAGNQTFKKSEYPELNIKADNIGNIKYVRSTPPLSDFDYIRTPGDPSRFNEEDNYIFELYAGENSIDNAPYAAIGSKIELDFGNNPPDSIKLFDQILKKDGNIKYDHGIRIAVPLENSGGKYSFILDGNPNSFFSSNFDDYLPGNDIRGFNMLCSWGGKEYEYSFVLRTDATFPKSWSATTEDTMAIETSETEISSIWDGVDFFVMSYHSGFDGAPVGGAYVRHIPENLGVTQMVQKFNDSILSPSFAFDTNSVRDLYFRFDFSPKITPTEIDEVFYVSGDNYDDLHYVDYPIKMPEEAGVYTFFVRLKWSDGSNEIVGFNASVKEPVQAADIIDFDGDGISDEVIFSLGYITDDGSLTDDASVANIVNAYPKITVNFGDGKKSVRNFNEPEHLFYRLGTYGMADLDGDGQPEIIAELQSMGSSPNNHIYALKYDKAQNIFNDLSVLYGYEFEIKNLKKYQYTVSCKETGFASEPNNYTDKYIIVNLYDGYGTLKDDSDNIPKGVDGIEFFDVVQTADGPGLEIYQYAWSSSHAGKIGYAVSVFVWKNGKQTLQSQRFEPYNAPPPNNQPTVANFANAVISSDASTFEFPENNGMYLINIDDAIKYGLNSILAINYDNNTFLLDCNMYEGFQIFTGSMKVPPENSLFYLTIQDGEYRFRESLYGRIGTLTTGCLLKPITKEEFIRIAQFHREWNASSPVEIAPPPEINADFQNTIHDFIVYHHTNNIIMNNDILLPEVNTLYAVWETCLFETALGTKFEKDKENIDRLISADMVKNTVSYLYNIDGNSVKYDDFYVSKDNPDYFKLPDGFSPDIVWDFPQWDTLTVDNNIYKFDVIFYNAPTDENSDKGEELRTFNYEFEKVVYKDKIVCYKFIKAVRVK